MAAIKYKDPVTGEWKYAGGGSTECDIVIEDDGAGNVMLENAVDVTGQGKEMKTLNGYEVVDAKAREDVAQLSEAVRELQKDDEDEGATEPIEYLYDGDLESDSYVWANIQHGANAFVKVADLPDGEIDLRGCEVSAVLPDYPHSNYSFVITDDMFFGETGLVQILYQNIGIGEQSPCAKVIICSEAKTYNNVQLNGWSANVEFPETGIYFADTRPQWGSYYVESLYSTHTNAPETVEESPTEYKGNEIQVFTRGLCIGDSITEGYFDHGDGGFTNKKYSYPTILKRITDIEIVNAGIGGLKAKTWYDASLDSSTQQGRWVNDEWVRSENPSVGESDKVSTKLDYSGYDFAVIHLGINDMYLMEDATLETAISTYETNIYNIINKLKAENAGIKMFLCTIIPSYAYLSNANHKAFDEKIREIANAADNVYLVDLNLYSKCAANTPYSNGHLTAIGYYQMAHEIKSIISYTINQNLADFKEVQFIGTDYHI